MLESLRNIKRKRGMSLFALIVVILVIGPYFKMLLDFWGPVSANLALKSIIEDVKAEPNFNNMSKQEIKKSILKRLSINTTESFGGNFSEKRTKDSLIMRIYKEDKVKYIFPNFYIVYVTDHSLSLALDRGE